jgi:hypothetical protein
VFGLQTLDQTCDGIPCLQRRETWGTRIPGARWEFEQEDEFTADAVAGGEFGADFGDGAAQEFFVKLGELAGGNDAEGPAEDGFYVGERVGDAVRGFVEDNGLGGVALLTGERFEAGAAGAGFFWQEADEVEFI